MKRAVLGTLGTPTVPNAWLGTLTVPNIPHIIPNGWGRWGRRYAPTGQPNVPHTGTGLVLEGSSRRAGKRRLSGRMLRQASHAASCSTGRPLLHPSPSPRPHPRCPRLRPLNAATVDSGPLQKLEARERASMGFKGAWLEPEP